jgi:alkanesulfonate monooxygenase SsuD/methylene tetrahydromethanopterin reductase-like flavin-dependent oxidoreductase (luciferase family)
VTDPGAGAGPDAGRRRMTVGVALPQMAEGLDQRAVRDWCLAVDEGPFSSISAGERITFHNLEGLSLCAAAAVLTTRVRVLANVVVLPWHPTAMAAKQLATIDVLSGGRLEVAVGIGGRHQDYEALGASVRGRHQRLDDGVAELRRLWAGGPAPDGEAVGPAPVQVGGPPLLASAMGPRSLARAARWADGVSGFTLLGDAAEAAASFRAAEDAWEQAGRDTRPRQVTGSFVALGDDAPAVLRGFAERYLQVFSPDLAATLAAQMPLHDPGRLTDLLDALDAAGCNEFIVVPASTDVRMVDRLAALVA